MSDESESILEEAKEAFEECEEHEAENRRDALDDIKFARLEQQWPENIRKQRQTDQRPCLTINKIPSFIRQVVNDARQNKPAIKVHPADDSADKATSEIMNGLIRNIEYTSNADVAYDTALECAVTSGRGFFRVDIAYSYDDAPAEPGPEMFQKDLRVGTIANPFSVWADPCSTEMDSSDWNVCFVAETMKKDAFEKRFKGADAVDWEGTGYGQLKAPWSEDGSVMIAEYWKRETDTKRVLALSDGTVLYEDDYKANKALFDSLGAQVIGQPREIPCQKVTQHLISGAEVLETRPWPGKYIPIIPVYGDEVNVEGVRYFRSMVRSAKDAQRMFNYWRTMATELVALAPKAPFIGRTGAFETDADKWATANTDSHAFIEFDGAEMPQRQPFAGIPAGALQEALNASDDMKSIIGIYDAGLGARSNETSGKAIIARQKEGDVSTFHYIDNQSRAIRHGGRVLIDLIPHTYSEPRIVRVMGLDGQPKNHPINQPTMIPQLGPEGQPIKGPDGNAQMIEGVYDLRAGKYDLTVEVGPSYTTKREEAAESMIAFMQAVPQAAGVMGDLIAKSMDWPDADTIADRLQALLPGAAQGQNPQLQQAQAQMQQLHQEATQAVGNLQQQLTQAQQQLAAIQADKSIEQQKVQIDSYKAETERMKAQHDIEQPSVLPRQPVQ